MEFNGRASISPSSELNSIYGKTSAPSALLEGAFARQLPNGSSRLLGSFEADLFKSHNHSFINSPEISFRATSSQTGFVPSTNWGGPNYAPSIGSTGGEETRPHNLAVNMFIKVKKVCNFI